MITNVTGRHLDLSARTPRHAAAGPGDALRPQGGRGEAAPPRLPVRDPAPARGRRRRRSCRARPSRSTTSRRTRRRRARRWCPAARPASNTCAIVFGVIRTPTDKLPEGMRRVLVLSRSDARHGRARRARVRSHLRRARSRRGARPAGRVGADLERGAHRHGQRHREPRRDRARRAPHRHVHASAAARSTSIVAGINVGAQSYFNALATMLMHTRGVLVMTARRGDGAHRTRGARGVGQRRRRGRGRRSAASSTSWGRTARRSTTRATSATRTTSCYEHYRYTYVAPGERAPRRHATADPADARHRPTRAYAGEPATASAPSARSSTTRPTRAASSPFAMRPVMRALVDQRTAATSSAGARGGRRDGDRLGRAPRRPPGLPDRHREPERRRASATGRSTARAPWTGGTLFPLSSKKVARALNAASGNAPGGDPRQPVGLRRLARVDAQAAARVRRRDRARGGQLRRPAALRWSCRATTAAPTWCSRAR